MSNKSPIFPILQPHHFTDYGFEPQIQEARKHNKRESTSRFIDLHFKLQKPIKKNKKRWWRNALLFFKFPKCGGGATADHRIGSISGPVYITESKSGGSSTPYKTARRPPGSGPLMNGSEEVEIPYISLRELNMDQNHRISATSATPIYLVT